jgi:hypothetical protein
MVKASTPAASFSTPTTQNFTRRFLGFFPHLSRAMTRRWAASHAEKNHNDEFYLKKDEYACVKLFRNSGRGY